jgi:hypothetical protein
MVMWHLFIDPVDCLRELAVVKESYGARNEEAKKGDAFSNPLGLGHDGYFFKGLPLSLV